MPQRLASVAAVIVAIPSGWLLGILAAQLVVGRDTGVFPVLTIPLGLAAAIGFALTPRVGPATRFAILAAGAAVLAFLV